jgi:hypothetical protein
VSERLTDEQLAQEKAWLVRELDASIHKSLAIDMIDEILTLRPRVAKLEAALKEIASRWRFSNTDELGDIAIAALKDAPDPAPWMVDYERAQSADPAEAMRAKCQTIAAIHSQYPITTDYDRGYAKARQDVRDEIAALKGNGEGP